MNASLLQLQRAMGDILLDERPTLREAPAAWAAAKGLAPADAQAVARYAKRLWVYRELVEFALTDPIENCFPITQAWLEASEDWDACLRAFLAARAVPSPYYRDLNPAFLAWLAESGWGAERWPALLSLAHWEHTEMELLCLPDEPAPTGLEATPSPECQARFRPLRHLTYPYQVHEASLASPEPAAGESHLLAWRDDEDDFQSLALSPHASALLGHLLQGAPLGEAAGQVGLPFAEILTLLEDLGRRGVLLGFSRG